MAWLLFLIIVGAVIGSFLNVCIFRLPQDESIVFPPSHCPHCGHPLAFWDLIPILSYIFLEGQCRYCGKKIAARYLLVEVLSAAIFGCVYFIAADLLSYVFTVGTMLILLVVFFTDLEKEIILDQAVLLGVFLGLVFGFMEGTFLNRLVALCGGYLFFFIIAKAAYWYYKKEAIGQGDLKFGAMLGAVLGISNLFLALFLAYLLGAGGALFLLVTKRKTLKDTIPFGPFLVLGGVIALLFGRQLIAGYLRLWL